MIESYLLGRLETGDRLVVEARLLLDKQLSDDVSWQQRTYALIRAYGRKCLKAEIEAVHKKMFSEKKFEGFREKIHHIFK